MAKGKKYQSTATKFVEYIQGLDTIEQFQKSFLENKPLGLLYKEMMNTPNQDRILLSSYYKLVNLDNDVKSGNIKAIQRSRDIFIADFEEKSKKPSRSLKTFWQKIKNKLSNALPNWTKSKTSDIQAEKTAPQVQVNKPTPGIAPPPPPLPPLPKPKSNLRVNSTTLKKTQNNASASRDNMFSELLAKTKSRREAEAPEASVVNSATQKQPPKKKEETAQAQVNKPIAGIAPPPPPLPPLPKPKSNLRVNSTTPKKIQNTQTSFQSELSKAIQQRTNKPAVSTTKNLETAAVNSATQKQPPKKKEETAQVQVNKPIPGIAPPPPPPLPNTPPNKTAKLITPKKAPVSRIDMFSELLAKTKRKREAETPKAAAVNSATREQPKQIKKAIAPQVQVNKPVQGIAPPPPPPLPQTPSVNFQPQAKKEPEPQVQVNKPVQGIAPPPPPPPLSKLPPVNLQPAPKQVTDPKSRNQNNHNTSDRAGLFAQIRKAGSKNLSKNHQNYTYIPIAQDNISDLKLEDVLAKAMHGKANTQSFNNPQVIKLLDGQNEQERLNILYSAFIDKNEALIKNLKSYKVNVAISNDDDWDTLEEATTQVTTTNIFTDKQYNAVKQAALETAQRIERGEDLINSSPVNKTAAQEVTPITQSKVMNPVPAPEQQRSNLKKSVPVASKADGAIPLPPADGAIPPPPAVKSYATPHTKTFLESIRNQDSNKLKSVKNLPQTLNTENFTYLNENKSDLQEGTNAVAASLKTRRLSINGNKELKKEFKTLDDKAKLNKLYSYIIDNDQAKIKAFLDYDSDSNNEVFDKENLKKIAKDIVSVANKNPKSTVQIHNGLKYFADQTDLDLSKIEKKSLSHAEQIKHERESNTQTRHIN